MEALLVILTVILSRQTVSAAVPTDMALFDAKLETLHSSFSAEIAAVKREIRIKVLPEIEVLKQCMCSNMAITGGQRFQPNLKDIYIQGIEDRMAMLVAAFSKEKLERKSNTASVDNLKENMKTKHRNLSELIATNRQFSENNQGDIGKQNDEITVAKEMILDLKDQSEQFHGYLNNISHTVENVCPRKKKNLHPPSFVSDWFVMKSQSEKSERVIEHGLGKHPAKVDVQIKPLVDANDGWIFSGDSVFQSDDDSGNEYSGVVYLYNETHVTLKTPVQSNNKASGILMSTCGQNNRFMNMNGEQYRFSESFVRVRIWTSDDLPEPTFTTDWLTLDVTDERKSFTELSHGLSDYPALVIVQIKSSTGQISEGMGAVMTSPVAWSNAGGVVYGFDDKTVRIWTAYLSEETRSKNFNIFGTLFGHSDGWGDSLKPLSSDLKGLLKLSVWSADSFERSTGLHEYCGTLNQGIISGYEAGTVDLDNDLVTMYVQALDGNNRGFLFKGIGASQSVSKPYGGAVYAYNKSGQVIVWRRKEEIDGYLIHINQYYGNGKLNQASNAASYRVTLLRCKA